MFAILLLHIAVVSLCVPSMATFNVTVDNEGNYELRVDGKLWLRSAPTFFTVEGTTYSTVDGGLSLLSVTDGSGDSNIGTYTSTSFLYQPVDQDVQIEATISWLQAYPAVVFTQTYLSYVFNSSVGDREWVSSAFPSFYVENATEADRTEELGYLAYGGYMWGDRSKRLNVWSSEDVTSIKDGLDHGPLALFTPDGSTVLTSSMMNPMAGSAQYTSRDGGMTVSWGLMGRAAEVPQGFVYSTVMYYTDGGINKAMADWGTMMRANTNKDTALRDTDLVNNYIGFWTDNGAYYYYNTEGGMNYEDTILAVKEYADTNSIPYKYVQYDSWWYYKGDGNGVKEWVARPDVFPNGISYLHEQTGWPLVAHNRWWSADTVYASQNGGNYSFIVEDEPRSSLPTEQRFWDDLLLPTAAWGLITYEQDWLNRQFNFMEATVTSLTLGRDWLHQMALGAERAGLTLQYCMAPSRIALASLEINRVTQGRVSEDYQPSGYQWRIGITSMFADALGVAPFKDTFWTTSVQPGAPYVRDELYPQLESVVATLSTGPVGPGDKIGYTDIELLMRSCSTSGLILKPAKPAMAVDKQIMQRAFTGFTGEMWSTYTSIAGSMFGIMLGADITDGESITIGPTDAHFGSDFPTSRAFSRDNHTVVFDFNDNNPITFDDCPKSDFCVYYTSPVFTVRNTELILQGELSKWVPMSQSRFTNMVIDANEMTLTLTGGANELVTVHYVFGGTNLELSCPLDDTGFGQMAIIDRQCGN